MATLDETISTLSADVSLQKQPLDDALRELQTWIDRNAVKLTDSDRAAFSATLNAEKDTPTQAGQPVGDDHSLILSILRLHAMRLLYRFDERREGRPASDDQSPYGRARLRLAVAMRDAELALNEARVDIAIANAHNILADATANHRWLADALTQLQTLAQKDLVTLADSLPMPDPPALNVFQRIGFTLLGIHQDEIGRRSLASLRKVAELQASQLIEIARLLADSFEAVGDDDLSRQALTLLTQFGRT